MKHTINFLLLLSALLCMPMATARETPKKEEVHNIILMIGDGMGLAQTASLMIEKGYNPISFDRAQYIAVCKTYSANNRITDSAAAATAMGTGQKTDNGRIGMNSNGETLTNLTELAAGKGLSTGIVVTSHLADATPAGFVVHAPSRYDYEKISAGYANAGIDVLAGGGRQFFEHSLDGRNIVKELENKGYHFAVTPEEFCRTDTTPLIGLFADKYMPTADIRGEEYLTQAMNHTLGLLSRNPHGFFALIEGSQIDIACHDNNTEVLHAEMRDFDNAVNAAFDFADEHPGTLVIVVADHETGGLTIVPNNKDFTAGEGGIRYKYSTTGHSGTPVILYAYGSGAENFTGVIQNTDIFRKIKALLIDKEE